MRVGRYKFNKKLGVAARIAGHHAAEDIIDPRSGEVLVQKDAVIDRDTAVAIQNAGINAVNLMCDEHVVRVLGNNFVDAAAYLPFDPHEAGVNEMAHLPTLLATIEGLVVGTVNSLLEMAPFNALLSNPGGKKLLGRVIRQAWLEGGTEAVQENVNMLAARYGHDTDLTWKDQVGRTIESGLAGAVLGGPTGLFAGVDQSDNKPPPPNVIPTVEK